MASRSQPSGDAKSAATIAEPSAAFTPGPWRALTNLPIVTRDRQAFYPTDPTGSVEICRVGNWPDKELRPHNGDRWMADARLIAAAPDLYEALCAVDRQVFCDCHDLDRHGHQPGCYVPILRAALAKASPDNSMKDRAELPSLSSLSRVHAEDEDAQQGGAA